MARLATSATLAALAVAVGLRLGGFRGWEAWTAGHVTSWFTTGRPYSHGGAFYVDLRSPGAFGLRVTNECTSAMVVIGVLGISAILALLTRLPVRRLVLAAAISGGAFYLFNLLRLVIIALATRKWGLDNGFRWSHEWAGTFVTVIGGVGVFALYLITIGAVGRNLGTGRAAT